MFNWMQSATAKVFGIGALALIMMIPLVLVRNIVNERGASRDQAAAQIARGWGGRQIVGGLVLAVPTQRQVANTDNKIVVHESTEIGLADNLQTAVTMTIEKRRYGMYEVPVFVANMSLKGQFLPEDLAQYRKDSGAQWLDEKAELRLLLSDTQGLQNVDELTINGKPHRFVSSAARIAGFSVIAVPIDLQAYADQPIAFEIRLKLAGTDSLQILPLARQSQVQMSAAWPDPSFTGAFLPQTRTVDPHGFTANWHVLDLNRNYGQHWDAADTTDGRLPDANDVESRLPDSAFGVGLYQPVDVYQMNVRAEKYGVLFISMTFLAFFLFEVLNRLRVHPVQYILIGVALVTFYVVLLAFSEQIGFGLAYLSGAVAVAAIIGGYAAAVLRSPRRGLLLGAVVALVYAVLYGLISAEQYALLLGAIVLLVVVALLMYLTRHIDWYAYGSPSAKDP